MYYLCTRKTAFLPLRMSQLKRRVLTVSAILLFALHYAGGNLFWHTHVVGSQVVSHSHPFTSTNHTQSDLRTISCLLSFATDDSIVCGESLRVFRPVIYTAQEAGADALCTTATGHSRLRAPPSQLFI